MIFNIEKTKVRLQFNNVLLKIVTCIALLNFVGCDPDDNSSIPLVQVYLQENINKPDYLNLQTIGGSVEIFGGSRGIILYRFSENEIKAYDRHCPYQPSNTCALVSVDITRITATDQCCGSSFLLQNGSVSKPPASEPLKSYSVIFNDPIITVTN